MEGGAFEAPTPAEETPKTPRRNRVKVKDVEPVFHFSWKVDEKLFVGLNSAINLQTI